MLCRRTTCTPTRHPYILSHNTLNHLSMPVKISRKLFATCNVCTFFMLLSYPVVCAGLEPTGARPGQGGDCGQLSRFLHLPSRQRSEYLHHPLYRRLQRDNMKTPHQHHLYFPPHDTFNYLSIPVKISCSLFASQNVWYDIDVAVL